MRAGLHCWGAGGKLGGVDLGFHPVALDATISHTDRRLYEVTVKHGTGASTVPVDTTQVELIIYVDTGGTLLVDFFEPEVIGTAVGGRIDTAQGVADAVTTRIENISYADGVGSTTIGTIETAMAETASRIVTLRGEYDDPATGISSKTNASDVTTIINNAGLASASTVASISSDLYDPATGLATRASSQDITNTIAATNYAAFSWYQDFDARITTADGVAAAAVTSTELATAIANIDLASYTAFSNVTTQLNDPTTGLASKASSSELTQAFAVRGMSSVTEFSDLKAEVEDPVTGLAQKASALDLTQAEADLLALFARRTIGLDVNDTLVSFDLVNNQGVVTDSKGVRVPPTGIYSQVLGTIFAVLADRLRTNAPLEFDFGGDNIFVIRPNNSTLLWLGPRGTALFQMTASFATTVFALPNTGNAITYQGEDLVSGSGAFSQTIEEEISGTGNHNTAAIAMTGNGKTNGISITLSVALESVRNGYTPTGADPEVGADIGLGAPTAKLWIQRSVDNGATWVNFHIPAAFVGKLRREWLYYDPNYDYGVGGAVLTHVILETTTFNKSTGTVNTTGVSGQDYLWRAQILDLTWPSGHTVFGNVRFTVEQN